MYLSAHLNIFSLFLCVKSEKRTVFHKKDNKPRPQETGRGRPGKTRRLKRRENRRQHRGGEKPVHKEKKLEMTDSWIWSYGCHPAETNLRFARSGYPFPPKRNSISGGTRRGEQAKILPHQCFKRPEGSAALPCAARASRKGKNAPVRHCEPFRLLRRFAAGHNKETGRTPCTRTAFSRFLSVRPKKDAMG